MVAGLGFLSKKSFNPKNLSNQKTVWEARQSKLADEKAQRERSQQLQREQEEEELARVRHGTNAGNKTQLNFMYKAPPGIMNEGKKEEENNNQQQGSNGQNSNSTVTALRQPGDDDAAAAFRAMIANHKKQNNHVSENQSDKTEYTFSNSSGAALQGSSVERAEFDFEKDGRSALEKAVGRKDGGGALSLEEQVARFPQLKNAPMAKGMSATDVQVNFKPLGTQLRNVRCMACGVWGHSRGDRECAKSGWDPFRISTATSKGISKTIGETSQVVGDSSRSIDDSKTKEKEENKMNNRERKEKRRYESDESSSYERRRRRRREKKKKKKRRKEEKRHRRQEDSSSRKDDYDYEKKRRKRRRRYDSSSEDSD